VVTAKRKDPPEQKSRTSTIATSAASLTIPAATVPKTTSVVAFINKKYNTSHQPFNLPSTTPRKRLKPAPDSRFRDINLPSVNKYVAATPLQIVGETPAKFAFPAARRNTNLPSHLSSANNNHMVGATPLQIIGETPAKQPRTAARKLKPNALDGVFVRHTVDMTPRPQHAASNGGLCFGLSPMPQQTSSVAAKGGKKKWK
jgi:hypothetical protein